MNRGLDAYALRQRTISKNIANSTAPHYRPEKVAFEELFQGAQSVEKGDTTDDMHIPIGSQGEGAIEGEREPAQVPEAEIYFSGENHVNIDKEMSELAQNQIRFRFASLMVKGYFKGMQTSIAGQRIT